MSMTWGNPWHGRVRNNFLLLPAGGTRFLAQPFPSRSGPNTVDILQESYGRTLRIAVPGVPAVERTAEEAAVDLAAGYRWQTTAVLSGGRAQLSGKIMDGWIYCDPAGSRWWVRCAQITDTANFNPAAPVSLAWTLTRFGAIGQPFEQYSYSVSLTDWGLDYPGVAPASVKIVIDDIRADGGAAVLMVHQRQPSSFNLDERRAYSFHELTMSGLGHEAVIAITPVRRNAEVLSAVSSIPPVQLYVAGYYQLKDAEGNVVTPWEWRVWVGDYGDSGLPPNPGTVTVGLEQYDTRGCSEQIGSGFFEAQRIVAMWYTADGALEPVVLRLRDEMEISSPAPTVTRDYWTTHATWLRVEHDGVIAGPITASVTATGTQTFIRTEGQAYTETTVGVVDGYESTTTVTVDEYTPTLRGFVVKPNSDQSRLYGSGAQRSDGVGLITGNSNLGHQLARYANHVIGAIVGRSAGVYAMHPPMTPSGVASGSPRVETSGLALTDHRYGSWDPHTHDTTWGDTVPVCYA